MNWYKTSNINDDPEDVAYITKTYGSVEEFMRRVSAIKSLIAKHSDTALEAAELTSDRTPSQIVSWLERNKQMAQIALELYKISGATGPNDKVWSDLDVFAKVWENNF